MQFGKHNYAALLAVLAGLLPIVTVNAAYLLNVQAGMEGCFPYLDGCTSVSRGIRSGDGLWLFRVLAVPIALCMAGTWLGMPDRLRGKWISRAGMIGAAFLVLYAFTLGTDGELYGWMRRYGVVFYFGLTGLAQLMLAARLWSWRAEGLRLDIPALSYLAVIAVAWLIGILSATKRQLFDNPEIVDRFQNALEWNFALALSLAFVAMAPVIRLASRPG